MTVYERSERAQAVVLVGSSSWPGASAHTQTFAAGSVYIYIYECILWPGFHSQSTFFPPRDSEVANDTRERERERERMKERKKEGKKERKKKFSLFG